jgi:putative CocE/NonD family hydrolase
MTKTSYEERLQTWERNRFAPPPAPDAQPTPPSRVLQMPMRDGITLYTEILLPSSNENINGAYPVVLLRSPYPYTCPSRNDRRPFTRYLDRGYVIVFQITRGLGKSGGAYHFFHDDVNDGYDCIEWIARQPWCNGHVGMEGASYLGSTQLLAARTKPIALKCIMPTAFVGNFTQGYPFSYGVPSKGPYLQWHQLLDADSPDKLEVGYGDMNVLEHPLWGAALRKRPLIDAGDEVLRVDK